MGFINYIFGPKHIETEAITPVISADAGEVAKGDRSANPHKTNTRSFFSGDVDRLLNGWVSTSNSIDGYLEDELVPLRARSREMVRKNPYGKRFITAIKSNVIGPSGVTIQAQTKRQVGGVVELDSAANDAIELAFADWASYHCDHSGASSWEDMQALAISCAAQDGEYIFRVIDGAGKYGIQLMIMDPARIDTSKNVKTKTGEIRLGIEYNQAGKAVFYHFKDSPESAGAYGRTYKINAKSIIHGFIREWPDQSRGIPWMHASLEKLKHLDKYDEAAMVAARFGASKMVALSTKTGEKYSGDEDGTGRYSGDTMESVEAGAVWDIGNRDMTPFDPKYPHEMYDSFVKSTLRGLSSGIGVSYHSISNDLEGVNYSSIRAGVLEDREIFKGLQNWFVRALIRPVYERWIANAVLSGKIRIGNRPLARPVTEYMDAIYQPRRWAWVDPKKDADGNQMALDNNLKTEGMLIEEQGGNPEDVWRRKVREQQFKDSIGLKPAEKKERPQNQPEAQADEQED